MADRPAPQHSAALNRLVGIQPPPAPAVEAIDRLEHEQLRLARRRKAAERSRQRRQAA